MRVVIIGAGHNCLVAADRLSRAGHDVEVLERRTQVGGACSTRRFECGCYVNEGANALGMLDRSIYNELDGAGARLDVEMVDPALVVPTDAGRALAIFADPNRTADLVAAHSTDSRESVLAYSDSLARAGELTRPLWTDNKATFVDFTTALEPLGPLGTTLAQGSLEDYLRRFFRDDHTLALFAAGNLLLPTSPCAPGTAFALCYLAQSQVRGSPGWGVLRGGMAVLAEALLSQATRAGARVHVNTEVRSILLDRGRAVGVVTCDGRVVDADVVISGADPYTTFHSLLPDDPAVARHRIEVASKAVDGDSAKINLLMEGEPDLAALREQVGIGRGPAQVVTCPTLSYLKTAFLDYTDGQLPTLPYCEVTLDHHYDSSASCGQHTPASVYVAYVPYHTPDGIRDRGEYRGRLYDAAVGAVQRAIPDFARRVVWKEVLLPSDLAERYGMHRGNVDHGPMTPDNSFDRRSVDCGPSGATAVPGLFLCGAGVHPGGLVSGSAGINTVTTVLEWDDA